MLGAKRYDVQWEGKLQVPAGGFAANEMIELASPSGDRVIIAVPQSARARLLQLSEGAGCRIHLLVLCGERVRRRLGRGERRRRRLARSRESRVVGGKLRVERRGLHQVRRLQLVTQHIARRVRLRLRLGTHRRELLLQRRLVCAAQPPHRLLQILARLRARRFHRHRTLLRLALFGLARIAPHRLFRLVPRGAHRGLTTERRLLRRGGPLQRNLLFDGRA